MYYCVHATPSIAPNVTNCCLSSIALAGAAGILDLTTQCVTPMTSEMCLQILYEPPTDSETTYKSPNCSLKV